MELPPHVPDPGAEYKTLSTYTSNLASQDRCKELVRIREMLRLKLRSESLMRLKLRSESLMRLKLRSESLMGLN